MGKPNTAEREILLAEDNLVYADILHQRLREFPFPAHLSLVTEGEAALAFLERRAPHTEAPRRTSFCWTFISSEKVGGRSWSGCGLPRPSPCRW